MDDERAYCVESVVERPNPQKILLVDDHELVRISLQVLLQTFGFEVDVAADDQEAFGFLKHAEYDFVISDLYLGEMNGLELLETCRERQPGIRTILLTGWVDNVERFDATAADRTLPKPLQVDVLLNAFAELEDERHGVS